MTTLEAAIVVLNGAFPDWRERPELAEAFRIVDAAGAFEAEPVPETILRVDGTTVKVDPAWAEPAEPAEAFRQAMAEGEAWSSEQDRRYYAEVYKAEPKITKEQARSLWLEACHWVRSPKEPDFEAVWAAVTGAK